MSSRTKIILLEDRFYTGEPTVQLVSTWGVGSKVLREKTSCHKTAMHSPALDYISSVEPEPGKSIVLIVGLGDHETYGPNRNGDGFPSQPIRGKIAADEVLTKHYKSYENAHVYEHHVNSDPSKAIGQVKKAFWNPHMRRVEVLQDFEHSLAPGLLEKIASGEFPAVSMGCLPSNTPIITTQGRVPIEEIAIGDVLLTHLGNWKAVTELHKRQYIGKLFSIHTPSGTSAVTSEHPYAVLPGAEVEEWVRANSHARRKRVEDIDLTRIEWVPAEALNPGDYLLTPFDVTVHESLTVDQCRLLGYYGAEGHTYHNSGQGVVFSHHIDDALPCEMQGLASKLGSHVTHSLHKHSRMAQTTRLASCSIADLCIEHVGNYACSKQLSLELMQQPKTQQLAFLGAYINGDGGCKSNGDYYISTCNKPLAYQLQQMGFRCGMYSKINTLNHKPSTVVHKNTTEYQVSFGRSSASIIAPYTKKVTPHVMKGHTTGSFFVGNCVVSKIKDISVLDFDGVVYNLEVKDDNSFIADNHAVHNCRIKYDVCSNCGNRAKTRGDYCNHLKYAMNRIDPHTGEQNAALNPSPVFFDSSWVVRPADRTGYMLKKVAREEPYELHSSFDLGELRDDLCAKAAALGKAADIEKILQGEPAASVSSLDSGDARLVERYKDECPCTDKEPQDKRIVRIMLSYKPSEALGTGDALGLPMGMKELLRYFLGRLGPEDTKEVEEETVKSASRHVSLIYQIYAQYPRFYSDVLKLANLTAPLSYNKDLAEKIALYAPQSVTQDYFARRMIPEGLRGQERGLTDMMSWTDPNTGQQYSTNYGTVQKTNDALVEQGLKRKAMSAVPLLGGSALLGGAALSMGLSKRLRGLPRLATGLAALGLGAAGAQKALGPNEISGPKVMTDSGETISGWTEMVPKRASATSPEVAYITKRASDGTTLPLPPIYVKKLLSYLKTAEINDNISQFVGPTLELDKVAQALGNSILKWIG